MNDAAVEILIMILEFNFIVAFILMGRKWLLKVSGPIWVYRLWYIPIVYLALSILTLFSPSPVLPDEYNVAIHTQAAIQKVIPEKIESSYLYAVFSFWLATSTILFTAAVRKHWLQTRNLKASNTTTLPNGRSIRTIFGDRIVSPSVFGIIHQTLLLPTDFYTRFTPLQQQLILQHEMTHVRRKDNLFNTIWLLLNCLFWFNPLSYFAWRALRLDQELSCDALILEKRNGEEKATYGELILAIANRQHTVAMHCDFTSSLNQTKERIVMLKTTLKPKISRLIGAGILGIYASSSFVLAQNEIGIVEEKSIRYVINYYDVLTRHSEEPLIVDQQAVLPHHWLGTITLVFTDEQSPQRVDMMLDTERAASGELLTKVKIDSYKDYQERETRELVFVGDELQHTIEFAENEITDQPFNIDFYVEEVPIEPSI